MKKLLTIAITTTLLSSAAFAGSTIQHSTFRTQGVDNKQSAYNAGFELADSLKAKSSQQLGWELSQHNASDIEIENIEVTVEEFASKRDVLQYRAILDVKYSFDAPVVND